jgi:hypothetical protein
MVERNKENQIKQDLLGKEELNANIGKTSEYIKKHDTSRRKLSLEADQDRSIWSMKQREANRRIVDTRNNLETIHNKQRALNENARVLEQQKRANQINKKIEEITNRRNQIQTKMQTEKAVRIEEHEEQFSRKAAHKLTELQVKDHEDHLRHFQKVAQKDDEIQQDLYRVVKEAEFEKRKKDHELKKLQEEFNNLKKQNAAEIKAAIAKAFAEEQEFQQKLLKEKAKLNKVKF